MKVRPYTLAIDGVYRVLISSKEHYLTSPE